MAKWSECTSSRSPKRLGIKDLVDHSAGWALKAFEASKHHHSEDLSYRVRPKIRIAQHSRRKLSSAVVSAFQKILDYFQENQTREKGQMRQNRAVP